MTPLLYLTISVNVNFTFHSANRVVFYLVLKSIISEAKCYVFAACKHVGLYESITIDT